MKKYQTFFNKRFGFKQDLQKSFWWYMNEYREMYFIRWENFNNAKPIRTEIVEIRGPRGGHTREYEQKILPAEKANQYGYGIWLIPRYIGLVLKVVYTNYVYKQYIITLGVTTLNWQVEFKIENICY